MKTLKKNRILAESHPEIAKQWHPTKNLPLTPNDVTYGSNTKAWWVCDKGHDDWLATMNSRTGKKPSGCQKCFDEVRGEKRIKAALRKSGTLAETHPDIARQWHPTKNLPLTPHDVSPGSDKKVWWVCDDRGHEWPAIITNRTGKKPTGCPKCSLRFRGDYARKAALRRSGTLAETHPDIARQWHPTKNLPFTPEDVTYGSKIKAWWVCDKGHDDWLAIIYSRTSKKPRGCSKCSYEVRGEKLRRSWKKRRQVAKT